LAEASRKSQAPAMAMPPPVQKPATAAMVGTGQRSMISSVTSILRS